MLINGQSTMCRYFLTALVIVLLSYRASGNENDALCRHEYRRCAQRTIFDGIHNGHLLVFDGTNPQSELMCDEAQVGTST